MNPTTIRYKCPKCGLVETKENHERRPRRPNKTIHLCWFCFAKGEHIEMEITNSTHSKDHKPNNPPPRIN